MSDYKSIPEILPCGIFIDPYELFEPDNLALKKVNSFLPELARIDEEVFLANVDKVVDKVCQHFGIP